jgi:hypothetical protein
MNQKYVTTTAYYLAFILLGLTIAAEGPTLLKLAEHTSSKLDQIVRFFSLVHSVIYLALSSAAGSMTVSPGIDLWQRFWSFWES